MASVPLDISDGRTKGDNRRVVYVVLGAIAVLSFVVFGGIGIYVSASSSVAAKDSAAQGLAITKKSVVVGKARHLQSVQEQQEVIRILKEHSATLAAVSQLATTVNGIIAQLPPTVTAVGGQVQILKGQLAAICAQVGAACPS